MVEEIFVVEYSRKEPAGVYGRKSILGRLMIKH